MIWLCCLPVSRFEYLSIWSPRVVDVLGLRQWPRLCPHRGRKAKARSRPVPLQMHPRHVCRRSPSCCYVELDLCRPADGAATSAFAIGRLKRDTEKSSSRAIAVKVRPPCACARHRACSHISTSASHCDNVSGRRCDRYLACGLSRSRVRRRRERLHAIDKALVLIRQWTGACASKRAIACSTTATIERRLSSSTRHPRTRCAGGRRCAEHFAGRGSKARLT